MKFHIYMVALAALSVGSLSAQERYINPMISHCVTQCYDKMKLEGHLNELSKDFMHVHECVENGIRGCEQDTLMATVKELQSHGFLNRVPKSAFEQAQR